MLTSVAEIMFMTFRCKISLACIWWFVQPYLHAAVQLNDVNHLNNCLQSFLCLCDVNA